MWNTLFRWRANAVTSPEFRGIRQEATRRNPFRTGLSASAGQKTRPHSAIAKSNNPFRQAPARAGSRHRICLIAGTRPEVVKQAPIYFELQKRSDAFEALWIATGQHTSLAEQAYHDFGIQPDMSVQAGPAEGELAGRVGQTVDRLIPALRRLQPDMVLVQGDTLSTLAGAMAASAIGVPVGHVEAGLRSFNRDHPFPEETFRIMVGRLADLHFAPTEQAARNLMVEGTVTDRIHITGNTVVDALHWAVDHSPSWPAQLTEPEPSVPRVLITTHRRESWDGGIRAIAEAVNHVIEDVPSAHFILPVHPNPLVQQPLREALGAQARVQICEPLPYLDFLSVLGKASLVLTDSGGVQEEAATLGIPTLVMRETTERSEAVEQGVARLVGTDTQRIREEAVKLLTCSDTHSAMSQAGSAFGDGKAASRVVDVIRSKLELKKLSGGFQHCTG